MVKTNLVTPRMRTVREVVFVRRLTYVIYRILLYSAVIIGSLVFSLPFIWMLRTSIMPSWQVNLFPPQWIPASIDFTPYVKVFDPGYQYTFQGWMWNSFVLSAVTSFGAVVSSAFAGFSFARLRFPGRDILFIMLLATMILPEHVRLVPTYLLFTKLGWIGSYKPITVPSFFAPAFFVFMLRQFFMTIPKELDDSAFIDGCTPLGLFLRIHLPMSLPALGVVIVFNFTGMWNDFLHPLLYVKSLARFPVAVGLRVYQENFFQVKIQLMMAAAVVSIIPTIILFFVAQRHLVQGIVITGVKG